MTDLKPCPWCGNINPVIGSGYAGQVFWGHCESCHARGPQHDDRTNAITAWNTRPAPKVKPLEWARDGGEMT